LEEATPRLGGESTERRFQSEDSPKDEVPILKNINLKIEKGKLYMIFGDIGSGKSMLLLSILNELNKKEHSTI
jgi:ABC-type lipoprotein export system ATPase subunit